MSPLKFRRIYEETVRYILLEKYAHDMKVQPAFLWNKLDFCKHGNANLGFLKLNFFVYQIFK